MAGDDVELTPTHEDERIPSSSGLTAPKKRIREMDETMDHTMDQSMDQTMDHTMDQALDQAVGQPTDPKMDHKMDQKTSCELCKTRKVKCDRAEPACSWCARHNRPCVYLKRQPPGSRTRINAELEAKVNRIDELLRALGRRVEEHIAHDHASSRGGGGSASFTDAQSPSTASQTLSSPASNLRPDTASVLGSFNGSSDAHRPSSTRLFDGDQTPRSQSASMIWQSNNDSAVDNGSHIGNAKSNNNNSNGNSNTPSNDTIGGPNDNRSLSSGILGYQRHPSLRSLKAELPPHDMLYTLVDLYFKHCNTWCPILDRKTIFGTFFGATSLDEQDRVLLHAIVTTTLRFSKDARLTPELRDYYHSSSKQVVRLYAMDHVTIPALRALVIVSLDEFGTSNGPRAWNMLAMVAQNVKQLGLCDEVSVYLSPSTLDVPQGASMNRLAATLRPDSWIEDEGRRRLCWVVYLLDRYATIGAASPHFLLEDDKMRRFLPCSYDLFSKNVPVQTRSSVACLAVGGIAAVDACTSDAGGTSGILNKVEHMGSFSYHCELLRILSSIHEFLRTPVDITSSGDMARWRNTYQALDATLDGWLRGLPSEFSKISALCHSDPASRVSNWFMLHSAYVTAVVRLHSAVAYPITRSTLFMPSQVANQRCLSAVHSLADIAHDLREANGLDLLGPPFAFSLWVAASCLLVHASTAEGNSIDSRIDVFIDTLRYVGQHWEVASNYAAILARVVQRARHGEITLAGMRRSAFDLQALTSTTRQSGSEPMSTHMASLCELDSIEVFTFFMYPRMPEPPQVALGGLGAHNGSMSNIWSPQLSGLSGGVYRSAAHNVAKPDWGRLGTPDSASVRTDDARTISDKGPTDFWGGSLYNGL